MTVYKIPAPARGCYSGAFLGEGTPNASQIKSFFDKTVKLPKIVMWFHALNVGFEFPRKTMMEVVTGGSIPFIKLEPWSWQGKNDNSFSLQQIIEGKFDEGLLHFAAEGQRTATPYFLSFGHEMNGDWYPWAGDPERYKQACVHIYGIFKKAGAQNHTWVFNPNVGSPSQIKEYYPGAKFVDWIALDGFNWGSSKPWSKWVPFEEIFGPSYKALCRLTKEKPLMIGEFASSSSGGDKAEWIREAFISMKKMDRIKAFVWFDLNKPSETDWSVSAPIAGLKALQASLKDPYFI